MLGKALVPSGGPAVHVQDNMAQALCPGSAGGQCALDGGTGVRCFHVCDGASDEQKAYSISQVHPVDSASRVTI